MRKRGKGIKRQAVLRGPTIRIRHPADLSSRSQAVLRRGSWRDAPKRQAQAWEGEMQEKACSIYSRALTVIRTRLVAQRTLHTNLSSRPYCP